MLDDDKRPKTKEDYTVGKPLVPPKPDTPPPIQEQSYFGQALSTVRNIFGGGSQGEEKREEPQEEQPQAQGSVSLGGGNERRESSRMTVNPRRDVGPMYPGGAPPNGSFVGIRNLGNLLEYAYNQHQEHQTPALLVSAYSRDSPELYVLYLHLMRNHQAISGYKPLYENATRIMIQNYFDKTPPEMDFIQFYIMTLMRLYSPDETQRRAVEEQMRKSGLKEISSIEIFKGNRKLERAFRVDDPNTPYFSKPNTSLVTKILEKVPKIMGDSYSTTNSFEGASDAELLGTIDTWEASKVRNPTQYCLELLEENRRERWTLKVPDRFARYVMLEADLHSDSLDPSVFYKALEKQGAIWRGESSYILWYNLATLMRNSHLEDIMMACLSQGNLVAFMALFWVHSPNDQTDLYSLISLNEYARGGEFFLKEIDRMIRGAILNDIMNHSGEGGKEIVHSLSPGFVQEKCSEGMKIMMKQVFPIMGLWGDVKVIRKLFD